MEPHSEKKGRLGGKFEEFTHTPRESVWDRIAAQPNDRPLGAVFGAFAWPPKPQVWRRIASELHPVPYFRIAAWTSAAAASIAMLLLFAWNGQRGAQQPGKVFANAQDLQMDATQRNQANLAALNLQDQELSPTLSNGTTSLADDNSSADSRSNLSTKRNPRLDHRGTHIIPVAQIPDENGVEGSAVDWRRVQDIMPSVYEVPTPLQPRAHASIAPSLSSIDRRTAFIEMLAMELENQAALAREDASTQFALLQDESEMPRLSAQAGASLTSGGTGAWTGNRLSDALQTDFNGLPVPSTSREETDESFQTPLVIGALVDHRIAPHVALGGGLVYTHLRSSHEEFVSNASQRLEISRQYLGVAANATYSLKLSKKGKLAMYGTGGLQFDFGLAKDIQSATSTFGALSNTTEKAKLGNQASVNGGIGTRYAIFKRISLYAQGTAAHYFYAPEGNLFTQKTIWPSGQIGLRLAL